MTEAQRQQRFRVILAFALVYVFWGSTYLGIGIAVEHIPPALMTAVRFLVAGPLMLAYCAASGRRVAIDRREGARLLVIGVLLLTIGNVVLSWAEQYVPTGLAALIVAIVPLWFLVIDTWMLRGDRLSQRGITGLLLGIAGVAVLLWPKIRATGTLGHAELFAALSLLGSSFSWALGSVLSRRWQVRVDALSATGWQMTFAGAVNLALALLLGEHTRVIWTAKGVGAIAYLIVCGSWIGFSAYIWLLQHVPTAKVATYAYVNPVIAVFLGWAILGERVDAYIMAGTVIVVAGVALVTSSKLKRDMGAEERQEVRAVESAGD